MQPFVGQSTWDEQAVWRRYRSIMAETFASPAGIFVVDDTGFPKQGRLSAGVQRQYCGASGRKANCQVAPWVHYVLPKGHYPLAMRLDMPEVWLEDPARLDRAGVPAEARRPLTKGQIALELLDQARAEGLPGSVVVADSCYSVSGPFRDRLAGRGLHDVVGVTGEMVVFAEEPQWDAPRPSTGGSPLERRRLAAADEPQGAGRLDGAAEGDLARGDQGQAVGPLRLAAGLAGRRLGHRRLRRSRPDLADDRGAGRRGDRLRPLEPAGGHQPDPRGASLEEPLGGGAGRPADEGRARAGPPRGSVVAGFPPPRVPGDAGLRVPGVGARAGGS
ncbi:transposase [Isosphaeraceae bacterium EP7]